MILTKNQKAGRRHLRRDGPATRVTILKAAERIFAEAGMAGARTDAIAAAARVNKAMLCYYFKSKNGLYRSVLEANMEEFHRQADEVLSRRGPAGAILLEYVSTHFDFIGARPYYPSLLQRLMMAGDRSVAEIIKRDFVPLMRRLISLIDNGVRSGEFRLLDARHAAISVLALTVFYFTSAPIARRVGGIDVFDRTEQAQRKREVLRFIRYALFKDPEAGEG